MIRPLRQRHRQVFMVLGIFLPVAFSIGIAARRPIPVTSQLPSSLATATQAFESVEWLHNDMFAKSAIQVRLLREHSDEGRYALSFSAATDFVKPDLLVYWSAGNPNTTNTVPNDAVLLGLFNSPQLMLPEAAEKSDGALVLFSLADNEIIDVSRPIRIKNPPK